MGPKSERKPYPFTATAKPFTMRLDEGIVTGWTDTQSGVFHRFHKRVLVRKGETFSYSKKRGFILNGRPVRLVTYPGKKLVYKVGWAAKKIRMAVFPEGKSWIAADTRSYNVSQGSNALEAMKNLISTLRFQEEMTRDEQKKGHKVIRWRVDRTPGTKEDMLKMEEKARKSGLLLESVEWK